MTIIELAETAGCNEKTVRRIGKELHPNNFRRGVKTTFTKEQCFDIMAELPKRNMVGQMSEQHRTNVRTDIIDYAQLTTAIVTAVVAALQQSKPVHYEQQQLDYTPTHLTLLAYSNNNRLGLTDTDKRAAAMLLKGICITRGLDIRHVPDERWGTVNSYPISILDEYFTP